VSRFDDLEIRDGFETHQATAGRRVVWGREALQVWDNGFTARRNPHGQPDTRMLIGVTDGGRRVTIIAREIEPGQWVAFTAWDTKRSDLG
jgi:hypothetical protein